MSIILQPLNLEDTMIKAPKIINYTAAHPFDGKTITINEKETLDIFEVKRIYWINYQAPEFTYSEHAHKTLEQVIVALQGSIQIHLEDSDGKVYQFFLEDPSRGLYIPPMFWKKIEYHRPCVLLCLASQPYNEGDYIRNYEEFKNLK